MAAATQGNGKIGLFWPVMFHLFNSIGFSHVLPVSLALFTRLAPRQFNATIIGIYYLAFFAANLIVGTVGGWYSTMDTVEFWLFHVMTAAIGLAAFALFKVFLAARLMGEGKPEDAALAGNETSLRQARADFRPTTRVPDPRDRNRQTARRTAASGGTRPRCARSRAARRASSPRGRAARPSAPALPVARAAPRKPAPARHGPHASPPPSPRRVCRDA